MASLVLGAAGAGIGAAIPGVGAAIGWTVGSTLGSMFFSSAPDQEGPRLNDLQIQDSSYGKPIPIVYGRDRFAGNIIWKKPLEEVKNEEEQGKGGGPTVTTYNYFATFALGLSEGEIAGIRRIWIDSKLVYKYTDDASIEELLASNATIDGITVYTGSESQDPDPIIQADKGAANTPAFRGLAYLVFDRLDVGNSGRIPNITVEVIGSGSYAPQGYVSSLDLDFAYDGAFAFNVGSVQHYNDGTFWVWSRKGLQDYTNGGLTYYDNEILEQYTLDGSKIAEQDISNDAADNVPDEELLYSLSYGYILRDVASSATGPVIAGRLGGDFVFAYTETSGTYGVIGSSTRNHLLGWGTPTGANTNSNAHALGDLTSLLEDAGATGDYLLSAIGSMEDDFLYVFTGSTSATMDTYYLIELVSGVPTVTETGSLSVPVSGFACFGVTYNASTSGCGYAETKDVLWGSYTTSNLIKTKYLQKSGTTFSLVDMTEPGLSGAVVHCFAVDGICFVKTASNDNLHIFSRNPVATVSDVTLSTIVTDLCERAGLTASDIDVSDLTDSVKGYTVTRPMSARKAIEPLMLAYHFDGGEYSNKLNFVKRGGSVVATIPKVDLGVDSDDLYTQARQQEAELPSEVILNYKDVNRDFQPGSQRSRRINTNVENVRQIDLAIALTADEAKQICEIAHYNAWVERDRFDIQVTDEYLSLNPTNVIEFVADGRTRKGRIVDAPYGPMMKLEMVAESGNYSSDAVAGESESVDQTLGLIGPTNLSLLDIPLLRNSDNDTAIYLAASGYYNRWSGCRVYKSTDDVSYSEVDALFNSATQGYTTDVLADANHTTWDRTSTVTLRLTSGSISSTTESNALKGSNPALIGNEIVHFVNVTDNGDGTYTLDTFLRGRRGTDWAAGTHAAGDRFLLLEESKMGRLEVVLNTARYFKGVSIGNYIVNAESELFTNTGVSLKPFSPVRIKGTRDGSGNLTITWGRRSRYIGGGLMPLPLFEASEEYKVQVLDALGGSVIRTLSPNPTTPTDSYSATDQTTDGFTPNVDLIPVRIMQISDTVGDGYAAEALI